MELREIAQHDVLFGDALVGQHIGGAVLGVVLLHPDFAVDVCALCPTSPSTVIDSGPFSSAMISKLTPSFK